MPSSTLFRDYLEMVSYNNSITTKARVFQSYVKSLGGTSDIVAHEKTAPTYTLPNRGPVADRVNSKNFKYSPLMRNTYGLSPRRITEKLQRDRD
ncbi:unnamed protein product [Diamesa serratosioi]